MSEAAPQTITPRLLLRAYSIGMFPMAESADDPTIFWVDPEERGIFPLDGLIVSRSLAKVIRSEKFEIRVDSDFEGVIAGCAGGDASRPDTWINARIHALFYDLFRQGHAHTVETWADGELVGGLYGLAIGGAFFGESMFHRRTDASKVALAHLVARLRVGGFALLDTQFVTPHLASLGAIEVSRRAYHDMLDKAIGKPADFWAWPRGMRVTGAQALAALAEE